MAAKVSSLVVDIMVVLLQLAVIVCNGLIIFLLIKEKNVRQNTTRLLVSFLTTTDFIHAVATLPYSIYILYYWDPVHFDLNPYFIIIAGAPFIVQLKINLTLTISIAAERILALFFPLVFRKLSFNSRATFCLLFAFSLGALDLILHLSLSEFNRTPGCGTIGCFLNEYFRYYWAISNMVMGIMVIVLTSVILVKLRAMRRKPQPVRAFKSKENNFKQANRNCAGILLISLIFITLPSVFVGVIAIASLRIASTVGPFYIVGLLCAGASNSVVYIALNKDMQLLFTNCFAKGHTLANHASSVKAFSITSLIHRLSAK